MLTINLTVFAPFVIAILILLFYRKKTSNHLGWFVLPVPLILFALIATYIPTIANGETVSYTMQWIPTYGLNFITVLDGLSMIFALLITGIGTLVILYSIYYLSKDENLKHFYIYLFLFMGSMLGVVFSDHIILLYVFWELTSISSFLLIAYWYHRKGARYGAKKSLIITIFGGFAMLIGFIILYTLTGTYSIREIITDISMYKDHTLFIPAAILILLGAFTKSAQFPFHIWLPDAMEAPTPVSAYLHSATMVKAGIYLVARFTPVFGGEATWFWIVSTIGLVTLFWGAFTAVRQTDLKALLAYSTVSQLGLIMSLLGVASLALVPGMTTNAMLFTQAAFAAIFHLMNHSTFKGALFMIIGVLDFKTGTRDIRRLGGLMALMPASFTIAVIGSLSMAGLPPFNGFLSKEMFFTAMLHVQQANIFSLETIGFLFPLVAWIASVFTFVYCLIIILKTFFGPLSKHNEEHAKEASFGMLVAPAVLGLLVILMFFFSNIAGDFLLKPALQSIYAGIIDPAVEPIAIWHGFNTELWMTIGIVFIGVFLYVTFRYWKVVYALFPRKWSFDAIYHVLIDGAENLSRSLTTMYMTGILRHYMLYIFIFFITATSITIFVYGATPILIVNDTPVHIIHWIISVIMILAAILILFAKTRLNAIILNGLIGFLIALMFVLLRAPDLALTQLVIETVTTALFLLCFYYLPVWKKEILERRKHKKWHLLISILVGSLFTMIALMVHNGKLYDSISGYFEGAYELSGGRNIVNAILADFRAFDTMLEVIVLFTANDG